LKRLNPGYYFDIASVKSLAPCFLNPPPGKTRKNLPISTGPNNVLPVNRLQKNFTDWSI
jgi:hypothetical protein